MATSISFRDTPMVWEKSKFESKIDAQQRIAKEQKERNFLILIRIGFVLVFIAFLIVFFRYGVSSKATREFDARTDAHYPIMKTELHYSSGKANIFETFLIDPRNDVETIAALFQKRAEQDQKREDSQSPEKRDTTIDQQENGTILVTKKIAKDVLPRISGEQATLSLEVAHQRYFPVLYFWC